MTLSRFVLLGATGLGAASLLAAAVAAAGARGGMSAVEAMDEGAVNDVCPITGKPVDPAVPTVEHEGQAVGFCCPRCKGAFEAWSEKRKDEFVRLAAQGKPAQSGKPDETPATPAEFQGDPYPFATCPVSGRKLSLVTEPIVKRIDGREFRFCTAGCVGRFEADEAKYLAKIDRAMIKEQLPYYSLETCVVSGEPLVEDGKDIAENRIIGNRLVRFCCTNCIKSFMKNPQSYMEKLDRAAIDKQRADYPLDTCVVSGRKLGSMGTPKDVVIAGRLVRLCCGGCEAELRKDVALHLATIDEAWKKKRAGTK